MTLPSGWTSWKPYCPKGEGKQTHQSYMALAEMEHCYGPIVYTETALTIATVVAKAVLNKASKARRPNRHKAYDTKECVTYVKSRRLKPDLAKRMPSIYRHLPGYGIIIKIRNCLGQVFD